MLQADADRINIIVTFEFLEMQTGVSGIASKNAVSSLRIFLNVLRETLE